MLLMVSWKTNASMEILWDGVRYAILCQDILLFTVKKKKSKASVWIIRSRDWRKRINKIILQRSFLDIKGIRENLQIVDTGQEFVRVVTELTSSELLNKIHEVGNFISHEDYIRKLKCDTEENQTVLK